MKALLVSTLPTGDEWLFEIKFDGVRAIAIRDGGEARLFSRSRNELSGKFSQIIAALNRLKSRKFVLDGEVVALDPAGRSSFQLLQSYHNLGTEKPPLAYYVFDILNLDGRDLTDRPLYERKELARGFLKEAPGLIRFSPSIRGAPEDIEREMKARQLEGLVAKRRNSVYEAGSRSGNWAKYKWSLEQEFVIGGYTRPKGGRGYFGALLVGYYDEESLRFAAKVGTGFTFATLKSLHARFQRLLRRDCPFANLPERLSSAGGLTAAQMRLCTWLEPELVCQIRFSEWTRDNHLRQPSFLGLREDKEAKEVVREIPKVERQRV